MKFIKKNPRTISTEKNDCVVRAMTIAYDSSYEVVHKACEAAGRRPQRGMNGYQVIKALELLTGREDVSMTWYKIKSDRPTMAQFVRANPKGRFLTIIHGHAVALIDGVYYDASEPGARHRVWAYARLDK